MMAERENAISTFSDEELEALAGVDPDQVQPTADPSEYVDVDAEAGDD